MLTNIFKKTNPYFQILQFVEMCSEMFNFSILSHNTVYINSQPLLSKCQRITVYFYQFHHFIIFQIYYLIISFHIDQLYISNTVNGVDFYYFNSSLQNAALKCYSDDIR